MRDVLGAAAALLVLVTLILGPAYVAVSTQSEPTVSPPRCEAGDIGCEIDRPPRPGP
jgi:hypothetical protein